MALRMTRDERQLFLAQPRIGIIGIEEPGRAPRVVPVWYDFDPAIGVTVQAAETSRKTTLLRDAGEFSLCVQDVTPSGYRHVSVQGPIGEIRPCELERDFRPLVLRYLGAEQASQFIEKNWRTGRLIFVMSPEHWVTADLSSALAISP